MNDYMIKGELADLRRANENLRRKNAELVEENKGMKIFMYSIPAHEAFTATNVFEIYQGWRDTGMLSSLIKKFKGC